MKDKDIINNLENLKKIREAKKITQTKLSIALYALANPISWTLYELISRYEVGSSFPQPNMLIKLANYFNCSVDYLLGLTDVTTSIKTLINSNNNENTELINKYNSLSNEGKKNLLSYLNYLVDKKNQE